MPIALDPFRFLLITLAGWMNQRQLQLIEYLREENRVLREQLGGRRLRLTDDQRRRLASKAKGVGRKLLAEVATIVTPETLLRWHQRLIAQKSMAARSAVLAAPERRSRSSNWLFRWPKKTATGDTGAFKAHCRIWGTNLLGARSLTFWNGTASNRHRSAGARPPGRNF
jgi:hypothetical protein